MGRNRKEYHRSRSRRSRSRTRDRSTRSGSSTDDSHSVKRRKLRKPTSWDVAAMGYEHLSPMQYKTMQASGQIASRIVPDAPPTAESAAIATVTRQARRLYVGNIPFNTSDKDMMSFFNKQIHHLSGMDDGNAVLSCQTNLEKNFAFLEFRSMDEATQAIAFDGITYRGQTLKIRRPHDYHPVAAVNPTETPTQVGGTMLSTVVPDTPHKIYIGGLPNCLNDAQVKELLFTFGTLRGFNLVKDVVTGQSKGFAFCEYSDPSVTEQAIAGLHGMQLGDRKLVVQRSIAGARNLALTPVPMLQVPGFPTALSENEATEVLCLLNMVQPDELIDQSEYEDIRSDIKQECSKYGNVKGIKIPRPIGESPPSGCGKVFVRFATIDDCKKALNALSGRKFSGRIVMTSYYDPAKYRRRDFK